MMTTVNEVNKDKTKVPDEFIFRRVSLVCFTAELVWDSQKMHVRGGSTLTVLHGG